MNEQSRSLKTKIDEKIKAIKTAEQRRKETDEEMKLFLQKQNTTKEQYELQAELARMQRLRVTGNTSKKMSLRHTEDNMPQIKAPSAWDLPTQIIVSPATQLSPTPPPFEFNAKPDAGRNVEIDLTTPEEVDLFQSDQERAKPIETLYTSDHTTVKEEDFLAFVAGAVQFHLSCTNRIPDKIEINTALMSFFKRVRNSHSVGEKVIPFVANNTLKVERIKCVTFPTTK